MRASSAEGLFLGSTVMREAMRSCDEGRTSLQQPRRPGGLQRFAACSPSCVVRLETKLLAQMLKTIFGKAICKSEFSQES